MENKKHFHFVTLGYHPDHYGGAYRYTTAVAERLAKQDHFVNVYCPKETENAHVENRNGVKIHWTKKAQGNFFLNWFANNQRIRRELLKNYDPNKNQCWYLCHAYLGPAIQKASIPYTFAFHGPWAEEYKFERSDQRQPILKARGTNLIYRFLRKVEFNALAKSKRIFVDSPYSWNSLDGWHSTNDFKSNAIVAGAGVDLAHFKPSLHRSQTRHDLEIQDNDFAFFTARRLTPRMGLEGLIECFRQVIETHPQTKLLIAGKGPSYETLNNLIKSANAEQSIRLLGFVPEESLPEYYSMADCTIVPSLDLEGFGLVTAESLACGTPVIGSDAGATADLLGKLDPDLVFQSHNPESLKQKINQIFSGKLKLPSRKECRAFAEKNLSWEEVAKHYALNEASIKTVQK